MKIITAFITFALLLAPLAAALQGRLPRGNRVNALRKRSDAAEGWFKGIQEIPGNRCRLIVLSIFLACFVGVGFGEEKKSAIDLILVAGQSNAVGFNAIPAELPADLRDRDVMFWWRTGDPPPDVHDSTSADRWTHLQPQPLGDPIPSDRGVRRQYGNFAQKEGGFGPEIGLARRLLDNEPGRKLAIVKAAFSGTGIAQDWNPESKGGDGACYRVLVEETRAAMAAAKKEGKELRLHAFVWLQGESDARPNEAPKYAGRLSDMIASLRRDLKAPGLLALVAVNTKFGSGKNALMPEIVEAQKEVAARDPKCIYVDTSKASIANGAHFDTKGTLDVGVRFAEALATLE